MDESEHGVIYVSLGTLLEPKDLKRTGDIFASILKHLPQRVIFKWDPKLLSTIPSNFFVQTWIPQVDVLSKVLLYASFCLGLKSSWKPKSVDGD